MDNRLQELYRMMLKEQWRVTHTTRETRYNLTTIHIYLEATQPVVINDFLGAGPTKWHLTFTAYHL